jgi:hypothetical protein
LERFQNVHANVQWNSQFGPCRQSVLLGINALGTYPLVDIFATALNPASHSEMTTPYHQTQYPSEIELHNLASWTKSRSKGTGDHIRFLCLNQRNENWIIPDNLTYQQIHDFFPNVESLALVRPNLTCPEERKRFECFKEKLTSLSLDCAEVDQKSLLAFVCLFPKLDNIKLNGLVITRSGEFFLEKLAIRRKFRGRLTLSNITDTPETSAIAFFVDHLDLVAFKEVYLENCKFYSQDLENLFTKCGKMVKKIKISGVEVYCDSFL